MKPGVGGSPFLVSARLLSINVERGLMARLDKASRDALPAKDFAGPHRSFPVNDADHARAALMDMNMAKGLTAGEKSEIRAEARKELKRNHPLPKHK